VVRANVVINATGPWSDQLRGKINGQPQLRCLRGSHLLFPAEKLPINAAITMLHPRDNRALFAIPWENLTMIGTTDLDHSVIEEETSITRAELDYLLESTNHVFPAFPVTEEDLVATFSGLRPVINTHAETPSQESRAHKIWEEDGLVTVAGGKLTIFRVMAADVLNFCRERLPNQPQFDHRSPCFIHPQPETKADLLNPDWVMMAGRLGKDVNQFFDEANPADLTPIEPLTEFWAELRWASENEAVVHLDDLLLRRVRVGLSTPNGGSPHMARIKELVQGSLGWTDSQWEQELIRYQSIWQKYYYLPHS